jgi:SAM-dependent methyltransferase
MVVKKYNPKSKCIGVDSSDRKKERLLEKGIEFVSLNIENQCLPFESETIDFIIANQVLEHTKEVFWIHHEICRTLKVGGYLFVGVPNILSLHNRILGLFGIHATCLKMISGHVRGFSRKDTILFYREIAGNFLTIEKFYGSQFYPFPRIIARPLAKAFPSFAFSIFFLIKKTGDYQGEFIRWLSENLLETNFYQPKDAEEVRLG